MEMRNDGRTANQLRPLRIETGYTRWAEGSALITQGETVVLCNATVEEKLPPWLLKADPSRGWVTAEYSMLPRSTHTRTPRATTPAARTQEIRRLIGRSLRATVNLEHLGARQIVVDCDVLQADGGTRTASVTGGYVALALALRRLRDAGLVDAAVFSAPVAAVSAGIVDGRALLDLCYEEDVRAEADFNVVMDGLGRMIEVQGTAERSPFERAALMDLLDLAERGIAELLTAQQNSLGPS
jgi:ribonuclease PH